MDHPDHSTRGASHQVPWLETLSLYLHSLRSKDKARNYYNVGPYNAAEVAAKAEARKKDIRERLQLEKQSQERKVQEKLRKKVAEDRRKAGKSEKMKQ